MNKITTAAPSAKYNHKSTTGANSTPGKAKNSQQLLERVSKDRTRGRRLRNPKTSTTTTTTRNYKTTGIPAAKASNNLAPQRTDVNTEVRLNQTCAYPWNPMAPQGRPHKRAS